MRIEEDFREFIELLNVHDVKYLIVGGYAVAFHAEPRATKDIDIFAGSSDENASKLMQVLADFGFANIDIEKEDFLNIDTVVQLGYSPIRIDILSALDGVEFDLVWQNRVRAKFGNQTAYFICLDDLIANKKSTGRLRDLADVEILEQFRKK